jgi:hypothetical protein
MIKLAPNLRMLICGQTQSGKSTFTQRVLMQIDNRIIYDVKRQYGGFGAIVQSIEELRQALLAGCNKLVFWPPDVSPEYFDMVCEFIFFNLQNLTFIVEEVQQFVTKMRIPPYFKNLITMCQGEAPGIASNIGIVAISQRPANVHNDIITQSMIVVSFMLDPIDAEALDVRISKAVIASLKPFEFALYDGRQYVDKVTVHAPLRL